MSTKFVELVLVMPFQRGCISSL